MRETQYIAYGTLSSYKCFEFKLNKLQENREFLWHALEIKLFMQYFKDQSLDDFPATLEYRKIDTFLCYSTELSRPVRTRTQTIFS